MNQYEVPSLIADKLPAIRRDLKYLSILGNVNKAMSILSEYTQKLIITHKYKQAQNCMKLVDSIYIHGNDMVRNAVENIYVYSFSLMSVSCIEADWKMVRSRIPSRLYCIYMKQVIGYGY